MKKEDDTYSADETERRRDATVRNMIATPPQKHAPLKAKRTLSRAKPATRKRPKKA